jgi:hypothetical protein
MSAFLMLGPNAILGVLPPSYRGWYAAVGVSLSTTMAINVVVPHVGLIMQLFLSPITRFLGARSAVTQVCRPFASDAY